MRKTKLALFFALICANLFSQEFLETDIHRILQPDLTLGRLNTDEIRFINFDNETTYSHILGLSNNESYVTSNAELSTIIVKKENIGRMVLHAKLFDPKDSLLFNPKVKRRGRIVIKSYRNDKLINEITSTTKFEEYTFQQIHLNTYKSGINKMIIEFESKNYKFILDKLKITPLNFTGINHYRELEKSEIEILDWSKNVKNEASKIKEIYKNQLSRIENSHKNLTNIINGQIFENMAYVKSNSLNPFKDQAFIEHYNQILDKASAGEKAKIETLSKDIGSSDFTNIALTLDNLFLGGKFATIIGAIDGLFKIDMNVKDARARQIKIMIIEGVYYQKNNWGSDRLKLIPIEDKEILSKIKTLNNQNEAYKKYVGDIAKFLKKDAESMKTLSEDISVAKTIKADLEKLAWEMIKNFSGNDKSIYFRDTGVSFSSISAALESNFRPEEIHNLTTLKKLRSESITNIKNFNNLLNKYNTITSRIKTHYDLLYEIRPNERKKHFNKVEYLPGKLNSDWKDKQDDIIQEYTKKDGLKVFLSKATGK